MKVDELNPKPEVKLIFKRSSYKQVPLENGCYILATFSNDILYVGLANNLHNRFQQHLDNPGKTNLTTSGKAVWFYYATYDPINLPKLERTLLNQFLNMHSQLPVLNKISSPVA